MHDEESLMDLARSGSEPFLKFLEEENVDLSFMTDINIGKKLVQGYYKINDGDFNAADFVFWIAYIVERSTKELILVPEVSVGIRQDVVVFIRNLFNEEKQKELQPYFDRASNSQLSLIERADSLLFIVDSLHFGGKIK